MFATQSTVFIFSVRIILCNFIFSNGLLKPTLTILQIGQNIRTLSSVTKVFGLMTPNVQTFVQALT